MDFLRIFAFTWGPHHNQMIIDILYWLWLVLDKLSEVIAFDMFLTLLLSQVHVSLGNGLRDRGPANHKFLYYYLESFVLLRIGY